MSKFLNRIAPQDEVLLETDIGTMIPSAEQLAEERVTRFNADKEIRLRVKALEETNSGSAIQEAKAAAIQARGDAEGFAEQASTSASNASTSATNAKTSETNAKTTADGLSAGLATLNSFDGRVTKLEDGKGIYKAEDGSVYVYTPLQEGDGTLAVLEANGIAEKIAPVEVLHDCKSVNAIQVSGDGEFVFFYTQKKNNHWLLFVYDKNLTRLGVFNNDLWHTTDQHPYTTHPVAMDKSTGTRYLWRATFYMKTKWQIYNLETGASTATLNLASGVQCVWNKVTGNVIAINASAKTYSLYSPQGVLIQGKENIPLAETLPTGGFIFAWQSAYFTMLATSSRLFMVGADDTIREVKYHKANVDANGYVEIERDADGNAIAQDWDCSFKYKPITTEVGVIPFSTNVTRGQTSYATQPLFVAVDGYGSSRTYLITNGFNYFWLFPDGRIIESHSLGTPHQAIVIAVSGQGLRVKPAALPNIALAMASNDALMPRGTYYKGGGRNDISVFWTLEKASVPTGDVFATRNASSALGILSTGIPYLGAQEVTLKSILNGRLYVATPTAKRYAISGMPPYLLRNN